MATNRIQSHAKLLTPTKDILWNQSRSNPWMQDNITSDH